MYHVLVIIRQTLIATITKQQMSFYGHICRREKLEYLVTTEKFGGKEHWVVKDKAMFLAVAGTLPNIGGAKLLFQ